VLIEALVVGAVSIIVVAVEKGIFDPVRATKALDGRHIRMPI
jgi:hypothetical protein